MTLIAARNDIACYRFPRMSRFDGLHHAVSAHSDGPRGEGEVYQPRCHCGAAYTKEWYKKKHGRKRARDCPRGVGRIQQRGSPGHCRVVRRKAAQQRRQGAAHQKRR